MSNKHKVNNSHGQCGCPFCCDWIVWYQLIDGHLIMVVSFV